MTLLFDNLSPLHALLVGSVPSGLLGAKPSPQYVLEVRIFIFISPIVVLRSNPFPLPVNTVHTPSYRDTLGTTIHQGEPLFLRAAEQHQLLFLYMSYPPPPPCFEHSIPCSFPRPHHRTFPGSTNMIFSMLFRFLYGTRGRIWGGKRISLKKRLLHSSRGVRVAKATRSGWTLGQLSRREQGEYHR